MKTPLDSAGRTPQENAKINAASLTEIRDALNRERDRLRPIVDPVVDGRPLERAHLINSWVLWMLRQPAVFRDQATIEGCDSYRGHLAEPRPVEVGGDSVPPRKTLQALGPLGPGSDERDRQRNDDVPADLRLPRSKK